MTLDDGSVVRTRSAAKVGALIEQVAVVEVDPAVAEECGAFREDCIDLEDVIESAGDPCEYGEIGPG